MYFVAHLCRDPLLRFTVSHYMCFMYSTSTALHPLTKPCHTCRAPTAKTPLCPPSTYVAQRPWKQTADEQLDPRIVLRVFLTLAPRMTRIKDSHTGLEPSSVSSQFLLGVLSCCGFLPSWSHPRSLVFSFACNAVFVWYHDFCPKRTTLPLPSDLR